MKQGAASEDYARRIDERHPQQKMVTLSDRHGENGWDDRAESVVAKMCNWCRAKYASQSHSQSHTVKNHVQEACFEKQRHLSAINRIVCLVDFGKYNILPVRFEGRIGEPQGTAALLHRSKHDPRPGGGAHLTD